MSNTSEYVIKRDGRQQPVFPDKISARIRKLSYWLPQVDCDLIATRVIASLVPGVSTCDLDTKAAELCYDMRTVHPEYKTLAARIVTSNLHKKTPKAFSAAMTRLREAPETAAEIEPIYDDVMANRSVLDEMIIYSRDYNISYEDLMTLQKSHLARRVDGQISERPQHYIVRRLVARFGRDIDRITESYHTISTSPEGFLDKL